MRVGVRSRVSLISYRVMSSKLAGTGISNELWSVNFSHSPSEVNMCIGGIIITPTISEASIDKKRSI